MHFVYIIYSSSCDRYYVGECEDIMRRIDQHNSGFYTESYTKQATDWELYYSIACEDRTQARLIETHIKKMKSRKYLENLKSYDDITVKLKVKYGSRGAQSR